MRECREPFVSTVSTFYIVLFSEKVCLVAFFTKQRYIKVWYGWYESNSPLEQKYILRKYFISWFSRPLNCWKQWPKKTNKYDIIFMLCTPQEISPIYIDHTILKKRHEGFWTHVKVLFRFKLYQNRKTFWKIYISRYFISTNNKIQSVSMFW